jgi:hypothetical protein
MNIEPTLPTKRAHAKAQGLPLYRTGKPCKNGHIDNRYTTGACVVCVRETSLAWQKDNRERTRELAKQGYYRNHDAELERHRIYREQNPVAIAACQKKSARKRWLTVPFYNVLSSLKNRAKHLGIPVDIDNDFLVALHTANPICPIFQKRMLLSYEDGPLRDRVSIDRFDPKGGYTRDNVRLLSYGANTIKSDHTDPAIYERMASYLRAT